MRLTYPRAVGTLCLVWAVLLQRGALSWPSDTAWFVFTAMWLAASSLLIAGRLVEPAAGAIAALSIVMAIGPGRAQATALALLFWLTLAIAVTGGRDHERTLLVRVTVTVVYAFGALAKLNPSFLSGEHLAGLAANRSQLESFEPLLRSNWGLLLSWLVIVTEAVLAAALWRRRTLPIAVTVGIVLHLGLILSAHNGTYWDVAFLTVLNGALVASYLAFFHPLGLQEPVTRLRAR